jgi:pimeloyl-ACP methyl ester carboxylesterase
MEIEFEGARVFAATGGKPFDANLPVLVFVHGAAMDHSVFVLQSRYFRHRGYGVLAVDLPGHGRSGGKPLATMEDCGAWLLRYLTALGVDKAAIAGHSMGSLIALEAAAQGGARISHLMLLGTAEAMPVHPDLMAAAEANDHLAYELVTSWGHGRRAHFGGHASPGLWMLGGAVRLLERAGPGVMANDMAACAAYKNGLAAAAKVTCPTLLLLGSIDAMTPPKAAQSLANALPNAEQVVLPNVGHMMTIEAPDATTDALRAFLGAP